jgi:hypothetical protein
MVAEGRRNIPQIKILGSPSIMCEVRDCGDAAAFLFRTGAGTISGYCSAHAREQATEWGIDLPTAISL